MIKPGFGLLAYVMLPAVAWAQPSMAITASPLPPPPALQVPNLAPQAPAAGQPAQQPATVQPQAAVAQPLPTTWLPQGSAQLQVLDKVNAQSKVLIVKVGQQGQFGSLTIQVQACDIRPPDQPQDSAAYLTITDNRPEAPGFQGWMLANEPSLSMLQSAIYDVRVVGCQA